MFATANPMMAAMKMMRWRGSAACATNMNNYQLVYPMFALVLLTMVVLATLFRRRVRAVHSNVVSLLETDLSDVSSTRW